MEVHTNRPVLLDRPPVAKRSPAMRWVKEWITQDLVATGGKVRVQKWIREDKLKALNEKLNTPEPETESEPTTEIEFFCTFEGCGKTFTDVGTLKKHTHVHGEKQHVCTYRGCGKKFLDSSKLKRHYLIHTGARDYVCPHEGCGKAFSLDFNLRAHMKTHSLENYHICPYGDCGKRFAHDYKLQAHIKAHHEKSTVVSNVKNTPPEKSASKLPAPVYGSASSDRPYACPYEGCDKAYIHEYKLNLHLKKEHPHHHSEENGSKAATVYHDVDEAVEHDAYIGKNAYRCPYNGCGKSYIHEYKLNLHLRKEHPAHNIDENVRRTQVVDQDVDEMGEHEAYIERNGFTCPYEGCGKSYIHEYKLNLHLRKEHSGRNTEEVERRLPLFDLEGNDANGHSGYVGRNSSGKNLKRSKPSSSTKTPPSKLARNGSAMAPSGAKKQWSTREMYEEDSEETEEEDHENADEDGWAYQGTNEDDEETEDED